MAVKVRLTRTGANRDNCFRVVAADSRSPRDGRFIEVIGWYDPKKEGKNFDLNMERVNYWAGTGAQISETVRSLIRRQKQVLATESK